MSFTGIVVLYIFSYSYITFGSCGELRVYLNDKESIQISLLPEDKQLVNFTDKNKAILRYGFHRTEDCQNFEKAFICIRKCLDLGYQIAHADKKCVCTCYKNKVLSQYKPKQAGVTKWKLGAPTTSLPPWAGKEESKPNDYEINANITEFVESKEKGDEDDKPATKPASEETQTDGVEHNEEEKVHPETKTPGTDNPESENPDAENPDTENPETENPETENPGTETPESENSETENPEEEHVTEESPPNEDSKADENTTEKENNEDHDAQKPDSGEENQESNNAE